MPRVFIGLGANMGGREENIRRTLALIEDTGTASVVRISGLVKTEPVGGPPGQPQFINAAAELDTDLEPEELLVALKSIERRLGRLDRERWGPREIDVDILLYDDVVMTSPTLEIPHPRMLERSFVLVPLSEIAPGVVHPVSGRSIGSHAGHQAPERGK